MTLFTLTIIEPIGLTKPKFSSIVSLSAFEKSLNDGMAITCPAQGLPLPSFRYSSCHLDVTKHLF